MSRLGLSAAEVRKGEADKAANTRAKQLAWAKATVARFPFRTDLLELIATLEARKPRNGEVV